jgi:hypothetical protein
MKYKSPHVIADPPSTGESSDEISIHSLIDRMRDTWAAGGAIGYAECFCTGHGHTSAFVNIRRPMPSGMGSNWPNNGLLRYRANRLSRKISRVRLSVVFPKCLTRAVRATSAALRGAETNATEVASTNGAEQFS